MLLAFSLPQNWNQTFSIFFSTSNCRIITQSKHFNPQPKNNLQAVNTSSNATKSTTSTENPRKQQIHNPSQKTSIHQSIKSKTHFHWKQSRKKEEKNKAHPILVGSLNELGRRQEPITANRMGMQFEHQLLRKLAVVHHGGREIVIRGRGIGSHWRLVQENPFAHASVRYALFSCHLLLATSALLLLLDIWFLWAVTHFFGYEK